MLAVMEQGQRQSFVDDPSGTEEGANGHAADFYSSGRTGRRNALPDILSEHAHVTSSDLPARLQALSTKDHQKGASTSQSTSDDKTEDGPNK